MKRIGILPNTRKDENYNATKEITKLLLRLGCIPMISENAAETAGFEQYSARDDMIYRESDFIIALGGDGTMLSVGKRAAKYNTPIMGINLGHLGFLTDSNVDEMETAVKKVLRGDFKLEKRMMLQGDIYTSRDYRRSVIALNEVSISRGSISDVGVFVNNEYIDDFFGDGILVSTPTGSTAYNLAAGGPILKSDAKMLAITPICPHKLHARSIVVGADDIVKLVINTAPRHRIFVVVDGQSICPLEHRDYIIIRKAQFYTSIIKTGDLGFYDVLREKMFGRGGR